MRNLLLASHRMTGHIVLTAGGAVAQGSQGYVEDVLDSILMLSTVHPFPAAIVVFLPLTMQPPKLSFLWYQHDGCSPTHHCGSTEVFGRSRLILSLGDTDDLNDSWCQHSGSDHLNFTPLVNQTRRVQAV